jgi:hypothetical protein
LEFKFFVNYVLRSIQTKYFISKQFGLKLFEHGRSSRKAPSRRFLGARAIKKQSEHRKKSMEIHVMQLISPSKNWFLQVPNRQIPNYRSAAAGQGFMCLWQCPTKKNAEIGWFAG